MEVVFWDMTYHLVPTLSQFLQQQWHAKWVMTTRFNIERLSLTRLPANISIVKCLPTDPVDTTRRTLYQQMLGCTGYLATTVRPDIAFTVSTLGQVAANPNKTHLGYA